MHRDFKYLLMHVLLVLSKDHASLLQFVSND